ncbi:MAG: hypothetical protein IPG74_03535 [Flavobacteriales bacterium]|nr:hypothetical protein [Flavobacteriales bacterium]
MVHGISVEMKRKLEEMEELLQLAIEMDCAAGSAAPRRSIIVPIDIGLGSRTLLFPCQRAATGRSC